jgi:hypothetical protein
MSSGWGRTIIAVLAVALIVGGIVVVNRLTDERQHVSTQADRVANQADKLTSLQKETKALQQTNKKLLGELDSIYRTRIASCQLNNARWAQMHLFLRSAIRARDRSSDPRDHETAREYEAYDRVIWPITPCDVSIPEPLRGS